MRAAPTCGGPASSPERRVEDARQLQVGTDLDARERHEADTRVVHLASEQRGQLAANLIGNPLGAGALGHLKQALDGLRGDGDPLHRKDLDDVTDLDVVELLEADAALEARLAPR